MEMWMRQHVPLEARRRPGMKIMEKACFSKHHVGSEQEAYDIRAVDMDRDGDLDLLVAGRGSRNVVWYEHVR